jgi:hypothetical protein
VVRAAAVIRERERERHRHHQKNIEAVSRVIIHYVFLDVVGIGGYIIKSSRACLKASSGRSGSDAIYGLYNAHDVALVTLNSKPVGRHCPSSYASMILRWWWIMRYRKVEELISTKQNIMQF